MVKPLGSGRTWPMAVAICVLTVAILITPRPAPSQALPTSCGDASISNAIVQDLTTVFRTQRISGELVFSPTNNFYERYPLMATFAMRAVRNSDNAAFVSRSTSAISRYYGYLFTLDENANLLLERSTETVNGDMVRAEDVAFNSLLAMDLTNLSRLYVLRRQPLTALYWYEGARAIQGRIVDAAFDPATYEFLNTAVPGQVRVPSVDPLASLPIMFSHQVGENVANEVATRYLLGRASSAADIKLPTVDTVLRALVASEALEGRGYKNEAEKIRSSARMGIKRTRTLSGPLANERLFSCALEGESGAEMFDPYVSLRLFAALVRHQKQLEDNQIIRTEKSVRDVIAFLENSDTLSVGALSVAETAMRNTFWSVSTTRDQVRDGSFFSSRDDVQLTAVNGEAAMERLLADATAVLKKAETRVFEERFRNNGVFASMSVEEDRLIAGTSVDMKWRLGSLKAPITITSAVAYTEQHPDTLVVSTRPLTINAGETITLTTRFSPPFKRVGGLDNLSTALVIEDVDGRRARFNATNSIYVDEPVTILAAFPKGRTLVGSTLPIELTILKRLPQAITFQYTWYSPSGLRPIEGTAAQMIVPAEADTVVAQLGVVIPEQCRPGTFPVRLKFKANGRDVGVINSTLYKPFQWIFVGPLAVGDRPMAKRYAPELSVDLLADYTGVGERTAWRLLGESAVTMSGAISLKDEMVKPGIGYLYTVISSDSPTETPALLSTNVPSALFINGKRVLEGQRASGKDPAYARVKLSQGLNEVLIKVHGDESSQVFFNLGEDGTVSTSEFGNNLWELIDGFAEIYDRSKLLRAGHDGEIQRIVVLRYRNPEANSVSVIGSFNGWSPDQSQMRKGKRGGWEITLSLAPGKYAYRFLVNSRQQVLDPGCPVSEPDGYGGNNSVIIVE